MKNIIINIPSALFGAAVLGLVFTTSAMQMTANKIPAKQPFECAHH